MSMKTGSTMHFEPGSWQEAVYDVYIGTLVGTGHSLYFFRKYTLDLFVLEPYYYLTGQKEVPELPEAGDLKIVGIGFGRTGTVGEHTIVVVRSLLEGRSRSDRTPLTYLATMVLLLVLIVL
jgi:hypothetical protein